VRAAGLGEDGLELAQALLGRAGADAVVLGDGDLALLVRLRVGPLGADGHDLALELARLLGRLGALERRRRERVLLVARDLVLGRNVLACGRRWESVSFAAAREEGASRPRRRGRTRDAHGEEAIGRLLVLEDDVRHLQGAKRSVR